MIFEVKCDERTKNERTNGPDAHTYCLFYSIRYHSLMRTKTRFTGGKKCRVHLSLVIYISHVTIKQCDARLSERYIHVIKSVS